MEQIMTSEADLQAALATAYIHCCPGGVALFVPDHVRETFSANTEHGGYDGEQRALRYLEWCYDPDEQDTTYVTDYVYMLPEGAERSGWSTTGTSKACLAGWIGSSG